MRYRVALVFTGYCLAFLATRTASAQQVLWAVTFDEEILRIDPATGQGTKIGTVPTDADAMGLAYYAGEVYVLDQINDQLFVFDPQTAALKRTIPVVDTAGHHGVFSEGDFEIRADGVGFYTESDGRFSRLNITTGIATQLSDSAPTNLDGLAFNGAGILYGYQTGGSIFIGDTATGAFQKIVNTFLNTTIYAGLEFGPTGELFVATDSAFHQFDPPSVTYTTIGTIGFDQVSGLTLVTVPEPAGSVPLGILFLFMAQTSRRWKAARHIEPPLHVT